MTNNDNCIFCKIIEGRIYSVKLYEDNICLVILDKFPATKGQSLVIPKKHESYIINLEDKDYNHIFSVAKKISKAIDISLNALRTCYVVEGFEVDHAHIRLHPAYEKRLLLEGKEETNEELKKIREIIIKKL